jgi:hypothetical protein
MLVTGIITPYLTLRYVVRSGFINSYRGSAKIPDYDSRNRFGGATFCMNIEMQRRQSAAKRAPWGLAILEKL